MKLLLLMGCCCTLLASNAFAMNVTTNPSSPNSFTVEGPSNDFTNWATGNGATQGPSSPGEYFNTFLGDSHPMRGRVIPLTLTTTTRGSRIALRPRA